MTFASAPNRLDRLRQRAAALDLRIRRAASEERERRRREDARSKIVIGGALLALLRAEPVAARALAPRLLPLIAERDRELIAALLSTPAASPSAEGGAQ